VASFSRCAIRGTLCFAYLVWPRVALGQDDPGEVHPSHPVQVPSPPDPNVTPQRTPPTSASAASPTSGVEQDAANEGEVNRPTPTPVAHERGIVLDGWLGGGASSAVREQGETGTFGIGVTIGVAALMVHVKNGFFMNWFGTQAGEGYEYHLLVVGMALALIIAGGGRWSLDSLISNNIKRRQS